MAGIAGNYLIFNGQELRFTPAESVVNGQVQVSVELKDWDRSGDHASSISLFGWCVSGTGEALAVEFHLHGTLLASAPLLIPRPDVVEVLARPGTPPHCGFYLRLSKFVLPGAAALDMVLIEERSGAGQVRVPLGTVAGLPAGRPALRYAERHQPLLLLGMGRSGTTYMMRLLAGHPDILVPGAHPYEVRQPVWLWHAAQVLSGPGAAGSTHPDGFESRDLDWLGCNPYRTRDWEDMAGSDPAVRWQEEALPAAAVDFCKQQVDEFVGRCTEGRAAPPRYVAQKMLVSPTRYFVGNVYAGAREVFLVRDFRDVWLSARSFNRRRSTQSFGRDGFPDDLSWLRGLAFSSLQMRLAHAAAGPRTQVVRYEDLMRDPGAALMRLLAGLGVDASPGRVQALTAAASSAGNLDHRTSEGDDGVGRWRTELTREEQAVAAEAFGEDLRYFGYEV